MHEYGCKGDKRYVVNLVLKGGMFLYTISNYEGRPTMDIDFMLRRMSNDVAGMERIMEKICQTDTRNDFIIMEVLGTRKITPEKKYKFDVILKRMTVLDIVWESRQIQSRMLHTLLMQLQMLFQQYLHSVNHSVLFRIVLSIQSTTSTT